jgi:hypothetical protein
MAATEEGPVAVEKPKRPATAVGKPLKNVPVVWKVGMVPITPINTFHVSITPFNSGEPAEMVLNLGFVTTPMLTGTPEEQIAQAQKIDKIEIEALARLTFSVDRAVELRNLLTQVLAALGK